MVVDRRARQRALVVRAAVVTAASLSGWAAGQTATWVAPGGGTWLNGSNWSTGAYPNSTSVDVLFPASGVARTIGINSGYTGQVNVHDLTIADPNTIVSQNLGTLNVAGALNIQAGTFRLASNLANATVSGPGTFLIDANYYEGLPIPSPTLDHVTFNNMSITPGGVNFTNGLTLNNTTITINPAVGLGLTGYGDQSITGTGTIVFQSAGYVMFGETLSQASGSLTIGPAITLKTTGARYSSFRVSGAGPNSVTNFGTISCVAQSSDLFIGNVVNYGSITYGGPVGAVSFNGIDNHGTINASNGNVFISGEWHNSGTFNVSNGTFFTDGTYRVADFLSINRVNAPYILKGTVDNTGLTFTADSPTLPTFAGVIVKGGVIAGQTGSLTLTSSIAGFDGATLDANITATGGLSLRNTVTLPAGRSLSLAAGSGLSSADGGAVTVAGGGEIVADPAGVNGSVSFAVGGNTTIGPGITFRTGAGNASIGDRLTAASTGSLTNRGLISAQNGKTIRIAATNFVNQGVVEAVGGGSIILSGTTRTADLGTFNANPVVMGTIDNTGATLPFSPLTLRRDEQSTFFGTIKGGTVNGPVTVVGALNPSLTVPDAVLDGVTLNGSLGTVDRTDLRIRHGLTLQGGTITLVNNTSAAGFPASQLVVEGPQQIAGSGTIAFAGTAAAGVAPTVLSADAGALTIGSTFAVQAVGGDAVIGKAGTTVVNQGTVSAQAAGRSLSFAADATTNAGTIEAAGGTVNLPNWTNAAGGSLAVTAAGSVLNLSGAGVNAGAITLSAGSASFGGTWTNAGTITIGTGATANFGGQWSSPGAVLLNGGTLSITGTFNAASLASVQRTAGTIAIGFNGTFDNTGHTLTLDASTGNVLVSSGGTVKGGTVAMTDGGGLTLAGGSTLDGVTLDSDLGLATTTFSATVGIANGLTLANGHVFTLSSAVGTTATLQFNGSQTLGGSGQISLAGTGSSNVLSATSGNLTIGPDITVTGTRGGTITAANGASVVNKGTIWSQTSGQTITLSGAWSSSGTLKLTAGTLSLGGSFPASSLDNLVQTGGTLVINGATDNAGHTLTLQGPISLATGGSISGGTVTPSSPSATIGVTGTPTLSGVVLGADVTVVSGGTLTLANSPSLAGNKVTVRSGPGTATLSFTGDQTLGGTGQILLDGAGGTESLAASGGTLTFGPSITVATGAATTGSANITGNVVNSGAIVAGASHPINIGLAGAGNFTNAGSVQVGTGGRVSFAGALTNNTGNVTVASGGTLIAAATATTNAGTITANSAAVTFGGAWTNTGTVSVNGGTLVLGGTSAQAGTFNVTGAAVTLAGPAPAAGSIVDSAVSVVAPYTTAQLSAVPLSGPASSMTLGAGGSLDNTSATWTLAAAAVPFRLAGGSITGGTIGSADGTPLAAVSGSSTLSNLTLNAPASVAPAAVLTLNNVTNNSTVTVSAGGTLAVQSGAAGTVTAGPGSTVSLAAPVSTLAAATLDGATFILKSSATTAELRSLNATGTEFTIGAGGTLTNTGDDLHPSQASNTWSLAGGTLSGGTIGTPITAKGGTATSTISAVTLASELSVANGASVSAGGSLTLGSTATVRFLGGGTVNLGTGSALTGTGQVVFDGPGATATAVFRSNSTLTIPAGVTLKTGVGSGTVGVSFVGLINQGLVSAQTPGQSLTITGSNWTNTGTLEATNNATLYLGGSFTRTAMGTVSTTNGGVAAITGALNNTGTFSISAASAIGIGPGGSVTGGTIASADGTPFYAYGGGTATANVTGTVITAPVSLLPGSVVRFGFGATTTGAVTGSGASLTIGSGATNAGSISLTSGSTLTFDVGGNPTGTISLADSTLAFNNIVSTSILKKFTRSNTTAQFTSTLTNTNDTLVASDEVGSVRLTSANASIQGGTVTTSGAARLFIAGTNKLNGVTMQGGITVQSGGVLQIDSLGLTPVNASVSLAAGTSAATFQIPGGTTLAPAPAPDAPAGTGVIDVSFNGTSSLGVLAPQTLSSVVTLGPGVTVRTGTQGGTLGLSNASVTSTGTISAQTPGKVLNVVGTFRNNNLVEVKNGGAIRFATIYSQAASGLVKVYPDSTLISVPAVTTTGRTDLAGGNLIYDYTSTSLATSLRNQLRTARTTAGDWSATTGLTCSVAAADPDHITAVGYAESATLLGLTGTQTGTWAGQTVDATAILARVTYYGDANLDGVVNADDYALLDRGLAKGLTGWTNGDFDYDGAVTLADYLLIDKTSVTLSNPAAAAGLLAAREARFGPDYAAALVASVPEPSTLILAAALPLLGRRRRASRKA